MGAQMGGLTNSILTRLFGFDVETYCALNTRPLAALKNGTEKWFCQSAMMGGPTLTQEEVEGAFMKEEGVLIKLFRLFRLQCRFFM